MKKKEKRKELKERFKTQRENKRKYVSNGMYKRNARDVILESIA